MKFTAANCTVLVEDGKGTILCDVVEEGPPPVQFAPDARKSAEKRIMAKRKRKKGKQSFCEGVMKSCRKRGKAKTPFCKSALKSCRKKARKGGGKKTRCPKGRVTRGKRKGRCRK